MKKDFEYNSDLVPKLFLKLKKIKQICLFDVSIIL